MFVNNFYRLFCLILITNEPIDFLDIFPLPVRWYSNRHKLSPALPNGGKCGLKQGIHPKIVQERLGHASIQITLDTYSHVAPGLQEAAAKSFDAIVNRKAARETVKID